MPATRDMTVTHQVNQLSRLTVNHDGGLDITDEPTIKVGNGHPELSDPRLRRDAQVVSMMRITEYVNGSQEITILMVTDHVVGLHHLYVTRHVTVRTAADEMIGMVLTVHTIGNRMRVNLTTLGARRQDDDGAIGSNQRFFAIDDNSRHNFANLRVVRDRDETDDHLSTSGRIFTDRHQYTRIVHGARISHLLLTRCTLHQGQGRVRLSVIHRLVRNQAVKQVNSAINIHRDARLRNQGSVTHHLVGTLGHTHTHEGGNVLVHRDHADPMVTLNEISILPEGFTHNGLGTQGKTITMNHIMVLIVQGVSHAGVSMLTIQGSNTKTLHRIHRAKHRPLTSRLIYDGHLSHATIRQGSSGTVNVSQAENVTRLKNGQHENGLFTHKQVSLGRLILNHSMRGTIDGSELTTINVLLAELNLPVRNPLGANNLHEHLNVHCNQAITAITMTNPLNVPVEDHHTQVRSGLIKVKRKQVFNNVNGHSLVTTLRHGLVNTGWKKLSISVRVPVFVNHDVPAVQFIVGQQDGKVRRPMLAALKTIMHGTLNLRGYLGGILNHKTFKREGVTYHTPAHVIPISVKASGVSEAGGLTEGNANIDAVRGNSNIALLRLMNANTGINRLTVCMRTPVTVNHDVPTVKLAVRQQDGTIRRPTPEQFTDVRDGTNLLGRVLDDKTYLRTHLTHQDPGLLLTILILAGCLGEDVGEVEKRLITPTAMRPHGNVTDVGNSVIHHMITQLTISGRLPVNQVVRQHARLGTIMLGTRGRKTHDGNIGVVHLRHSLHGIGHTQTKHRRVLHIVSPDLDLTLNVTAGSNRVYNGLILGSEKQTADHVNGLGLLPLNRLSTTHTGQKEHTISRRLPRNVDHQVMNRHTTVTQKYSTFRMRAMYHIQVMLHLRTHLLLRLGRNVHDHHTLVRLRLHEYRPNLDLTINVNTSGQRQSLSLLLNSVTNFYQILYLSNDHNNESYLTDKYHQELLTHNETLPHHQTFITDYYLYYNNANYEHTPKVQGLNTTLLDNATHGHYILT